MRRGWLTTILCVLAAPIALFLVFRTAVDVSAPALAASVPAVSPSSQLRQRARNVAHPDYKVDAATLELAREAAAAEPLHFLPYFIAARAAQQSGDDVRAVQLMEEARRRNTTWVPIRLYLVAYYGSVGRVPDMIREMDFTLQVNEAARFALLPEMVKLLGRSDGRAYVAQLLASDPPWKRDFFAIARDRKIAPAAALELLQRAARRGGDTSAEEQLYVSALVSAGQADVARERWVATLPEAERAANRFIFNGDFARPPAASEFGWKTHSLDVGRADIVEVDAGKRRLRVQYHGGRTAVLAEQQLALRPGSYGLRVTGRSTSNTSAAQFFWTVSCYPEGPELHRMPIQGLGAQDKNIAGRFTVPGGSCRSQTIRLVAEPGELSSPTDAEFAEVRIDGAR
ncbi:MAG TPA: hypothetical protein VEZ41_13200 [Allosphingosinicella sp.]|nr:hypothetical protein [Allosphingosinicella sp.]